MNSTVYTLEGELDLLASGTVIMTPDGTVWKARGGKWYPALPNVMGFSSGAVLDQTEEGWAVGIHGGGRLPERCKMVLPDGTQCIKFHHYYPFNHQNADGNFFSDVECK